MLTILEGVPGSGKTSGVILFDVLPCLKRNLAMLREGKPVENRVVTNLPLFSDRVAERVECTAEELEKLLLVLTKEEDICFVFGRPRRDDRGRAILDDSGNIVADPDSAILREGDFLILDEITNYWNVRKIKEIYGRGIDLQTVFNQHRKYKIDVTLICQQASTIPSEIRANAVKLIRAVNLKRYGLGRFLVVDKAWPFMRIALEHWIGNPPMPIQLIEWQVYELTGRLPASRDKPVDAPRHTIPDWVFSLYDSYGRHHVKGAAVSSNSAGSSTDTRKLDRRAWLRWGFWFGVRSFFIGFFIMMVVQTFYGLFAFFGFFDTVKDVKASVPPGRSMFNSPVSVGGSAPGSVHLPAAPAPSPAPASSPAVAVAPVADQSSASLPPPSLPFSPEHVLYFSPQQVVTDDGRSFRAGRDFVLDLKAGYDFHGASYLPPHYPAFRDYVYNAPLEKLLPLMGYAYRDDGRKDLVTVRYSGPWDKAKILSMYRLEEYQGYIRPQVEQYYSIPLYGHDKTSLIKLFPMGAVLGDSFVIKGDEDLLKNVRELLSEQNQEFPCRVVILVYADDMRAEVDNIMQGGVKLKASGGDAASSSSAAWSFSSDFTALLSRSKVAIEGVTDATLLAGRPCEITVGNVLYRSIYSTNGITSGTSFTSDYRGYKTGHVLALMPSRAKAGECYISAKYSYSEMLDSNVESRFDVDTCVRFDGRSPVRLASCNFESKKSGWFSWGSNKKVFDVWLFPDSRKLDAGRAGDIVAPK